MQTFLNDAGTSIIYLAGILTIVGFVLQLLVIFKGPFPTLITNSRKMILHKIARSNSSFSKFYDTVRFGDDRLNVRSLFTRALTFVYMLAINFFFALIFKIALWMQAAIFYLLFSALLSSFVLEFYQALDDFSQFRFTEHQRYIFTVLKTQIEKFSLSTSQNKLIITIIWMYLFSGIILIIGPFRFISYVFFKSSNFLFLFFLVLVSIFSLVLWYQSCQNQQKLISWAFDKYRDEENLKIPIDVEKIGVNRSRKAISGVLFGIGDELAILQSDDTIMEIPWKKVDNVSIGRKALLLEENSDSFKDFFGKLIGQRLTIFNILAPSSPEEVNVSRAFHPLSIRIDKKMTRYFNMRTDLPSLQLFLNSWEIVWNTGKHVLALHLSGKANTPPYIVFSANPNVNIIIRTDDDIYYNIVKFDLENKMLLFKKIQNK